MNVHALSGWYLGKEASVPTEKEPGWDSELVWTFQRRENLCLCQELNPRSSSPQPGHQIKTISQFPNAFFHTLHWYWCWLLTTGDTLVDCVWNVMVHVQKPDFVFRRNGQVHYNQQGLQFSWLLAAEAHASAVVMLDTPCSKVV